MFCAVFCVCGSYDIAACCNYVDCISLLRVHKVWDRLVSYPDVSYDDCVYAASPRSPPKMVGMEGVRKQ
jgi:hypothetical protein